MVGHQTATGIGEMLQNGLSPNCKWHGSQNLNDSDEIMIYGIVNQTANDTSEIIMFLHKLTDS